MRKFCKVFETEETQVLVFIEYNDYKDITICHMMADMGDFISNIKMEFEGDKQEENAKRWLEEYNQNHAEAFVKRIKEFLDVKK